jgi:hypothetical protein
MDVPLMMLIIVSSLSRTFPSPFFDDEKKDFLPPKVFWQHSQPEKKAITSKCCDSHLRKHKPSHFFPPDKYSKIG